MYVMPRSSNRRPGCAKSTTAPRKRRDHSTAAGPTARDAPDRVVVGALGVAPRARQLDARQVRGDRADRGRDAHLVVVEHDHHLRPPVAQVVERLQRQAAHQRRVAHHDRDPLVAAAHVPREREALRDRQPGAGVAAVHHVVRALRTRAGSRPRRPAGAACRTGPGGRSAACGRRPGGPCPTRCGPSGCPAAGAARPSARRRRASCPGGRPCGRRSR